ncbi:MAG TPA: glycoside hydrolase family 15 protein [Actinomycetota bacterium]|nr:glycoside hydrolase family 15 protein [Actinomycetota bacterium]
MSVPLEDYAFLSDMESAALVSTAGSVDWLCWPRFDSPACFCALLDDDAGGTWSLRPAGDFSSSRRYLGDSLVLETTFETPDGVVAVTDCLALEPRPDPGDGEGSVPENLFVRRVVGVDGRVPMRMVFRPRLDYGSIVPWLREHHGTVEAVGGPDALDLFASIPLDARRGEVVSEFEVARGGEVDVVLSYHRSHEPSRRVAPGRATALIDETVRFWDAWAARADCEGPRRDQVLRSLVVLKGLTYAPSGGIVAAPTTSLPEQPGGERNWDYRYCWLRDATFTLDALLDYGYTAAARAWRDWLLRAVAGDPEDMQIMYGVLGERRLVEVELPLEGYDGSRPVRVGNAAHTQFQLDVYGELMDSFHSARRQGIETSDHAWALEREVVDHVCRRWREPDDGIWEVRSGPRHFVHSKVMAWVALDRGITAVETFGKEGPSREWAATRDAVRDDVLRNGVDPARRCFVRSYGETEVDASLLMLPLVGFVEAGDEVMANTIDAIREDLMVDGLVRRYRTHAVDDGLAGGEGTFLMCTFWLVDCLVLLGRHEEARDLFDRVSSVANDLGLFSEQYDTRRRRQVGNFPQAFSHVAFLTSARALASAGAAPGLNRGRT